ncbi:DegT/DnrJ/EryC1/StrS family aminotransferase [Gilvimarinus sp. F26214L]|uniref:DegT/DnrJ/EryC1/StrS family aminotransferase n=1 Tax=Gilvimarinus sp. DZF01 TaxID=3461371 RepID=UPI0040461F4D
MTSANLSLQTDSPHAIPMVDLRPLHRSLEPALRQAIDEVIQGGDFVGGQALQNFEHAAAQYLGAAEAIGVNSGTDALMLVLRALGIGPGDEVITTPFSFWATAEAIHTVGARSVYVDIDPRHMNMVPSAIDAAVTSRTRAILPVHIFGHCADMPAIMEVAAAHQLPVVEDAAQAFGGRYRGRAAGTFGKAGCFSFYPSKPLGCFGDGGMIVTDDLEFAARLRRLNNHGASGPNTHVEFGQASRLDTLQAAVLQVKLQTLGEHLSRRRMLAEGYCIGLDGLPVEPPVSLPECEHCFAQFTVRCERRDELRSHLAAAGIASAVHYPVPLYHQPAQGAAYDGLHLPVAETCSARCLSLPLYQGLTDRQQAFICEQIARFFA